jgi:hypothetical protein
VALLPRITSPIIRVTVIIIMMGMTVIRVTNASKLSRRRIFWYPPPGEGHFVRACERYSGGLPLDCQLPVDPVESSARTRTGGRL